MNGNIEGMILETEILIEFITAREAVSGFSIRTKNAAVNNMYLNIFFMCDLQLKVFKEATSHIYYYKNTQLLIH